LANKLVIAIVPIIWERSDVRVLDRKWALFQRDWSLSNINPHSRSEKFLS